ncbi:MAG: hypothetical protein RR712_04435 [Terrisporobacter sp.]
MNILNFGTYTRIIKNGMNKATNESVSQDLLGIIINNENLFQAKHGIYHIDSSQASKWINGKENIPNKIRVIADKFEIENISAEYFNKKILFKLNESKQEDTYSALLKLINSDTTISEEKKNILISFYNNDNYCEFLAKTFLYAIQKHNIIKVKNKTVDKVHTTIANLKNTTNKLKEIYQQYPTPKTETIPPKIQNHEETYITEILKAYADAENLEELSPEDLNNYKRYKRSFEKERTYYYAAQSLEKLSRDIFSDDEIYEFDVLKEETLDGVIRIAEKDYPNGLIRLNTVMEHVTTLSLNKSQLVRFTTWIGVKERMGICHMLVKDGQISWVYD